MRVLVFGDSITQGFWDTEGGWVARLRRYYDELQITDLQGRDDPAIFNLGVSADTSRNLLERIENETKSRTRHDNLPIVIVQIGVNDASRNGTEVQVSLEQYKANLGQMIQRVQPLCGKLAFVGLTGVDETQTMPVFWGEYYYDNASTKMYEDAMKQVATEHNLPFIPVFDEFMQAAAKDPTLLPDGLHPSNAGHEIIFQIVAPRLLELLATD